MGEAEIIVKRNISKGDASEKQKHMSALRNYWEMWEMFPS
jgi:hypothetical protein